MRALRASTLRTRRVEGFEAGDAAGHDEEDLVRAGGDGGVEGAELIGEVASSVGGRVYRESDLFGDDHGGVGAAAERVEQGGGVDGEPIGSGDPAAEGVDQDDAGRGVHSVRERGTALDGGPRRGSAF